MPSIPVGIATVLLTGRYIRPDGTPLTGTLTFEPPASLTNSGQDIISAGYATVELDVDGSFSVTLMATDDPGTQPVGWAYTVVERLHRATGRTFHLALPAATPVVNLADIAPTDPSAGDYVVVTGPKGKDGTQIYSGTGAPSAGTGAAGDFYFDLTPDALRVYGPRTSSAWPATASALVGGTVVTVQGAAGDGVADDLAVCQAAVDRCSAAGGGTVVFPPGKAYGLSDYLYVPSNITLYAYGATIKAISTHGLVRLYRPTDSFTGFNGHSSITVLGGTWDANAYDGTAGTVKGLVDAFTLGHNRDITFRDVTIKNVSCAHAIDVTASRNVRVLNCKFLGFKDNTTDGSSSFREAIQLDAALSGSGAVGAFDNTVTQDVLVDGCYFGPSERLGPFGRAVGSHTSVSGDWYDNVQVVNCRVEGALQEAIRPYAWRRAVIANNVITGTGTSSIVVTGPDPATAGYGMTSQMVTIAGNIIEAPATNTPIRVVGFAGALATGVRIHGNTVINSPTTGIYVSFADRPSVQGNTVVGSVSSSIYAISCTDPQITANMSSAAVGTAIGIDTCTGGTMTSNTVDGAASGTGHGCYVANSSGVLVSGNRISGARGSAIRVTTSASRCMVLGNHVDRAGVTALGLDVTASATDCVIVGNVLSGGGWTASTAYNLVGTRQRTDWTGLTAQGDVSSGLNLAS